MSAIATRLITIARNLGRWILRSLARLGADRLVGYLLGKADDFERRRKRAERVGNERRVAWLTGRISRWTSAARWLAKNAANVSDEVVKEAERAADRAGLPVVADGEIERKAAA